MCIDKKLLITFIVLMACSLMAMSQSSSRERNPFESQDSNAWNVEIFPNPTSDFIHVNLKDAELSSVGFEMYNIIGNKIRVEFEQVGKNIYKIPVKNLTNGYYMLIVKDDDTLYRKAFKFMKI